MEDKVEKGQASLYVDLTCPICQKQMAMSNAVEVVHGIYLCHSCHLIPNEIRTQAILLRLLVQKEDRSQDQGGRFKGQVATAKRRSQLLQNSYFIRDATIELLEIVNHSLLSPILDTLRNHLHTIRNAAIDSINQLQKEKD